MPSKANQINIRIYSNQVLRGKRGARLRRSRNPRAGKAIIVREGRVTSSRSRRWGVKRGEGEQRRERIGEEGGSREKCISVVVNDERGVPAAVIAGKLCYYEQKSDVTLGHSCGWPKGGKKRKEEKKKEKKRVALEFPPRFSYFVDPPISSLKSIASYLPNLVIVSTGSRFRCTLRFARTRSRAFATLF